MPSRTFIHELPRPKVISVRVAKSKKFIVKEGELFYKQSRN